MNRVDVLEFMYKVIKDSLDWGLGEKEYGYFVNGVVAMVEETSKELEKKELEKSEMKNEGF